MEFLLVVVLLALLGVWAFVSSAKPGDSDTRTRPAPPSVPDSASLFRAEIDKAVERDLSRTPMSPELRPVKQTSPEHTPPNSSGDGGLAWSPRTQQLEVAGEWYRREKLRALFRRHATISASGAEIRLPAVLVPDGQNPYDANAVAVFVDGLHVGYMERADAKRYHRHIKALPGGELVVTSRQWLRADGDQTWARVTLSVPAPDQLACPNPFDPRCIVLPPGSTVQVTREEEHMDHLVGLLERYGSDVVIAATLRSVTEQRPRSTVELVAVDIDGRQVGVLTPTQTANFLPLVRKAEADGREVVCRASLRGNTLKADVALHARKAHELDEAELTDLFAHDA